MVDASKPQIVLARTHWLRLLLPVVIMGAFAGLVAYAATTHDLWRSADGELTRRSYSNVSIGLLSAWAAAIQLVTVAAHVRSGGAAVRVADGRLFLPTLDRSSILLDDIDVISPGPEVVFEGVPVCLTFHLRGGGRRLLETTSLERPDTLVAKLEAVGARIHR